ncbi:hypothetical protein OSTOST_04295, partial [Ostertagia ostertagi]
MFTLRSLMILQKNIDSFEMCPIIGATVMVDYYAAQPAFHQHQTSGYDYTQQEEEWDREGLLDPAWEKQQKKQAIGLIEEDFRNGLKLMLLLEVISGEPLPRPDRGKMRFHKIANVNKALEYIESKGVKLVSIGAEELSARDGLLLWCQRKTAPYNNVNVQNFHTSWKDGLAFCALIHRHRPELIDYYQLHKGDPIHNLNLAFDVAEKHLDIPRMLDAEDAAHNPDEKSIMTYVSCFYHAFRNAPEVRSMPPPVRAQIVPPERDWHMVNSHPDEKAVMTYVSCYYHYFSGMRKAETAANRICRVLKVNQENEKMMQEYEHLASDLLAWINHWMPWLANRKTFLLGTTFWGRKARKKKLGTDYRHEKPPRIEDKGRLENVCSTHFKLVFGFRIDQRSFPETDILSRTLTMHGKISKIRRRASKSGSSAKSCVWNDSNIWRKSSVVNVLCMKNGRMAKKKRFVVKTGRAVDCTRSRLSVNATKLSRATLVLIRIALNRIALIARELNNLRYPDIGPINARCQSICSQWDRLGQLATQRRTALEEAERVAERLDTLYLDFAKRAAPFNNWLDGAREDLADLVIVHEMREIQELCSAHDQFKSTLGDADKEFASISAIELEIERLVEAHGLDRELLRNPYTDLAAADIRRKWGEVQQAVPRRDGQLQSELRRQQNNERLRSVFADKANQVGPWLERELEQ